MRVLVVSNQYAPAIGGIEVLLRQLCPALRDRGHEVSVLTSTHRDAPDARSEIDGIPVHRVGLIQALMKRDPAGVARARRAAARVLDEVAPDVVHGHDLGANLWVVMRAGSGVPVITTMHVGGLGTLEVSQLGPMTQLLCRTSWLTGVSQAVVDDAVRLVPELADRCSVIVNGVPPSPEPEPPDPQGHRIVGAGRLAPEKGFDVLLRALPAVLARHPSTELLLAGDGPCRQELETLLDELDIRAAVTMAGGVRHDRIPGLLASANVVAIPSRYEGMPLIALEAAAAGRPLVATPSPGIAEVVVDGATGTLVPSEDPEAMAVALSDLLGDPARAATFGAAGRRRVVDHFSLVRTVDAYDDLFNRLTRAPAPS
jgi:glycogen(starch) synthase